MIALLVVAAVVGTVFAPRTQGRSLQQIERERYGEVVDLPADGAGATTDSARR